MSGKAKFRLLLLAALAGVCGYVGFLVFKERDPNQPIEAAMRAYEKEGKELEKMGQFKAAAEKYDQANVLLEHAIKRLNGPHGMDLDATKELSGKVLHMKALAIRDKYYALAAANGKPLPESTDTVTGQKFRNVLEIPDSKDRDEASGYLRGAALVLTKNEAVQLDAMRLDLMRTPVIWESIEKYAKAILDINPNDNRSKYLLARIEFEQYQPNNNQPTAIDKRSPDRVKVAKRYIDDVKAAAGDDKFPIWRTEFLKAQVHRWFMKRSQIKDKGKYLEEMDNLDRILLDDSSGAIARIKAGEGLTNLGAWDTEAVIGLHAMAADLALEEIRTKRLPDPSPLTRVFQDTLVFCQGKIEEKDPTFTRPMMIGVLLNLMGKSQTILATHKPREWQSAIDTLRPLLHEEFESGKCEPYRIAQFAELLMRESQMRKERDPKKSIELRAEAKKWLDDGLKFGKEHNLTNLQMMPFNVLAANVFYFNTDKRDELTPYLTALQETKNSQARALALVIDGALDEREGRLEKARWKMESALKIANGEEEVRAHSSLANIYMALGLPEHALVSLTNLQHVYERYGELSDLEQQWMGQFLRSPHDYYALLVIASLEDARKKVEHFYKVNPKINRFPSDVVKESEDRVNRILSRELPRQTNPGYMARTAYVNYLIQTKRLGRAMKEWLELNQHFPERVEVLRLRIGILQLEAFESNDPKRLQTLASDVDTMIEVYIKTFPANQSAKLLKALWLAQTRRNNEALTLLKEISEQTGFNPELRRVAAAVILSMETGALPMRVVRHVPRNPQVDAVFEKLGQHVAEQQRDVRAVMTRYESNGLSRALEAEKHYHAKDYAKAAEAFAGTLDFTRIKALAQHGVIRSLFALADQDTDKALALNKQMLYDFPEEPALLLTYAYIFLLRDEIGSPTDNWEIRRTMGSALNVWERLMAREVNDNPVMVPLTRAEYWFRANRVDIAQTEMQRALQHDRQSPSVLGACIYMILDDPAREPKAQLREYLNDVKRLAPDVPTTLYLTARVEEFERNWPAAITAYETLLERFPSDRNSYMRLIDALDTTKDYARADKWVKKWRAAIPNDLQAIGSEIRILARKGELDKARSVAAEFLKYSADLATERLKSVEGKDPAEMEKFRTLVMEDTRWLGELEIARGFHQGGAYEEAEKRLSQLPDNYRNGTIAQETLGEVYLKQKQWSKAQAVFEAMHKNDKTNWAIANNLAYLYARHLDKPWQARDVIMDVIKTPGQSQGFRSADRFRPDFLATVGSVYVRLNQQEQAKEMLDFYRVAAQRYPNDPRIKLYLGFANELSGNAGRAKDLYEEALRRAGNAGLSDSQRMQLIEEADFLLKR